MSLKIFTLTHKKFDIPPDPMYIPLQVGRAIHDDLGYLGDDSGDNISEKNIYYSELTGHYWIWKNVTDAEYVGVCHYRRYLINEQEKIFTKTELEHLLKQYDLITTRKVILPNLYYDGYAATHHVENLDITAKVIQQLYPEYYAIYEKTIHGDETYFGNILICKKSLFDAYAKWLFSIFQEMEKYVDFDSYDDYHKRVYGFISEILLLVYVRKNQLSVYECKVGMLGEKVETKELKETLYYFLEKEDYKTAKTKFLEFLKKRPDVLMETSDITGELKLVMQIIATCEMEEHAGVATVLHSVHKKEDMIHLFYDLNNAVDSFRKNQDGTVFLQSSAIKDKRISEYALYVSAKTMCAASGTYDMIAGALIQVLKDAKTHIDVKNLHNICFSKEM